MSFTDPAKLCQNAAPPVGAPSAMDLTGLLMEPKLDGFRLLACSGPNGVDTYTRTGKSQKGKLPIIEAALATLPEGTWLDGELVAFDDKGFPEWGKVQTVMGSTTEGAARKSAILTYVVFDVLSYGGLDIRPLPLEERRMALEQVVENIYTARGHDFTNDACVRIIEQCPASHAYHDALVAKGMEGTIVKDPAKPYASGKRGHGWTKFKANDEMDVIVMGYKPGENSFTGMVGALVFGQFKDGELVERGRCSGMTMKMRQEFTDNQADYMGSVISVAFMGIMPSGSPRHPQFKRLRIDKSPLDCEWT